MRPLPFDGRRMQFQIGDAPVNLLRHRKALLLVVACAALCAVMLSAQQPASQPQANAPAGQPAQAGQTLPGGHPDNAYWRQFEAQLATDFGDIEQFREADVKLGPPAPGEDRVVFMGDSITQGWHLEESFPAKPYINRGISGQTTPQMLVRFRQDVIDLKPKVVVILGGTNDIAGNTRPMTPDETEGNIASMAQLARANRIRVVLCSVLPSIRYWWVPDSPSPALAIEKVNAWIEKYAAENGYVYVDYHSAMADKDGGLPPNLSRDGVHPAPAGYAIMAPLAQAGIEKALKGRD